MNFYNIETLSKMQLVIIAVAVVVAGVLIHTLRGIRHRRKVKQKIPTLKQLDRKLFSITLLFVLFILWATLEHMKTVNN